MWETLAKIVPPPLLLGLVIYGLACFLFLQPLIERRQAVITYIPQCEAGNLPKGITPKFTRREAVDAAPGTTGIPDIPPVELPLSVQIVAELKGLFRDDDNRYALPYQTAGSSCACAVATAFDSVFWRSLVNVMSLRIYQPRAIEHFDQHVAQVMASGVCTR